MQTVVQTNAAGRDSTAITYTHRDGPNPPAQSPEATAATGGELAHTPAAIGPARAGRR